MAHRVLAVLSVGFCVLLAAGPASARLDTAGGCTYRHSELVDANAYVVVTENEADERSMCDVAVGVWRPLINTEPDRHFDTLRISGHYVGFSGNSTACENCNGDDSWVGVKNAATGRTVFMRWMHLTESRDANGYEVPDMTLKPNGSVAFTATGNWRHGWYDSKMVIKHDQCGGTRILDSSRRKVHVRTLRRVGSQLRWRHGSRARTAELC